MCLYVNRLCPNNLHKASKHYVSYCSPTRASTYPMRVYQNGTGDQLLYTTGPETYKYKYCPFNDEKYVGPPDVVQTFLCPACREGAARVPMLLQDAEQRVVGSRTTQNTRGPVKVVREIDGEGAETPERESDRDVISRLVDESEETRGANVGCSRSDPGVERWVEYDDDRYRTLLEEDGAADEHLDRFLRRANV